MKKALLLFLMIPLAISAQNHWAQIGQDLVGDTATDEYGYSVAMNAAGNIMAVGAIWNDSSGTNAGHVKVYSYNGSAWIQLGNDIVGEAAGDESGSSVSLNDAGNRVAIGAPLAKAPNTNEHGHVRVYAFNGSTWNQLGGDIDGESNNDLFGESVDLNSAGNRLVVGASGNDGNGTSSGHARVYEYSTSTSSWVKLGSDIDGASSSNGAGKSVAINATGDQVVIGSPYNSSGRGHVRIFSYSGTAWSQVGSSINGEYSGDNCGWAVDMNASGNRIAIGAPLNKGPSGNFGTYKGHVRVYEFDTTWTQLGTDIDGLVALDRAGYNLALDSSGTKVVVASPYHDVNSLWNAGGARLYHLISSSWTLLDSVIEGDATDDLSGFGIACDAGANLIVMGAPVSDANGTNSGKVKVFKDCTAKYGSDVQVACHSYTWTNGVTYMASNNTATDTMVASNGCDSVITLDLTIKPRATGTDIRSSCDSIVWLDGNTYTSDNNTATYTFTGGAANGCDSLVTLDLTIGLASGVDVQYACDSLVWRNGQTYYTDNFTATDTIVGGASSGCDSVVTLNLTLQNSSAVDVLSACDSLTWIDGNTYTSDNFSATHTLTNASGCDSVVTLNLTVEYSVNHTDVIEACDSLTWIDGLTYYTDNDSAVFVFAGGSSTGCDSIVSLDLTMHQTKYGTDNKRACRNFTWRDGITYSSNNNTAQFVISGGSPDGCDSVITLNLVIDTINSNISSDGRSLMASDTNISYQWLDCDNQFSPISGATSRTFTPSQNGNYALQFTSNSCVDTSQCLSINTVGVIENQFDTDIIAYPNPTNGQLNIDLGRNYSSLSYRIIQINGTITMVEDSEKDVQMLILEIDGPSGFYLIELLDESGKKSVLRVIKQ